MTKMYFSRAAVASGLLQAILLSGLPAVRAQDAQAPGKDWSPLVLKLPAPVFSGTPKAAPAGADVDPAEKAAPPVLMPPGITNIAPGKKISSSDKSVSRAELAKLTDGNKEADGENIVQLRKGSQWIQFDLGAPHELYAVAIWHAHDLAKIFRAVIVQAADDQDFTQNVRTLFNNDRDNSAGLGSGTDRQYFETYRGKTVPAKGAKARYVRLYSNGSTDSVVNEYLEVEIYGRPAQ